MKCEWATRSTAAQLRPVVFLSCPPGAQKSCQRSCSLLLAEPPFVLPPSGADVAAKFICDALFLAELLHSMAVSGHEPSSLFVDVKRQRNAAAWMLLSTLHQLIYQ